MPYTSKPLDEVMDQILGEVTKALDSHPSFSTTLWEIRIVRWGNICLIESLVNAKAVAAIFESIYGHLVPQKCQVVLGTKVVRPTNSQAGRPGIAVGQQFHRSGEACLEALEAASDNGVMCFIQIVTRFQRHYGTFSIKA